MTRTGLALITMMLLPLGLICCSPDTETNWLDRAEFTGSEACRSCHEDFFHLWADSHHGLALQEVDPAFCSRNLTSQTEGIRIGETEFQFEQAHVTEKSGEGSRKYEIKYAMGGKNVFYFLTERERGHLQVLPVAYDVHRQEWYDTTASMVRHFPDRQDQSVEWTDRSLTFNTSCYNCHVSQLSTNYELESDTYKTTWLEPGINCEACHGPGREHIRAFFDYQEGAPYDDLKIIDTKKFTPRQKSEMCAPCHAKMYPLSPGFEPGERLYDHYGIHTLEHIDFYPDGRDLGENFTYTLWLLSPCAASGKLDCVYCHTSSGRNRFQGDQADQACYPCHQKEVLDPAAHSFHQADGEGSRCVSCHMPRTEFARMIRHDHSMLGPTPRATLEFESPNACNICHQDQSAEWADQWARRWYGEGYQDEVMRRARLIRDARQGNWSNLSGILDYINDTKSSEVYVASLVRLLAGCDDVRKWPALERAFRADSPLVRAAVADGVALHPDRRRMLSLLLEAVSDDYRLVRVRAAAVLAELPLEGSLTPEEMASVEKGFAELEASLNSRPDDWSSHYNLGNYQAGQGRYQEALEEYDRALRFRPEEIPILVNQSMVYARTGENDKAEELLRKAVEIEPGNEAACFNLGLLLAEKGKPKEAEFYLRDALKVDPGMGEAAHNLAILIAEDRLDEALALSRMAVRKNPENSRYRYTLSFFLHRKGLDAEAIENLETLLEKDAGYLSAYPLLGSLLEAVGRNSRAREIYSQALDQPGFSPRDREYFKRKAEQVASAEGGR